MGDKYLTHLSPNLFLLCTEGFANLVGQTVRDHEIVCRQFHFILQSYHRSLWESVENSTVV